MSLMQLWICRVTLLTWFDAVVDIPCNSADLPSLDEAQAMVHALE